MHLLHLKDGEEEPLFINAHFFFFLYLTILHLLMKSARLLLDSLPNLGIDSPLP